MKSRIAWMVTLAIVAMAGLTRNARADQNPATDDVVSLFPYTGTLEKDGTAVSGPLEMKFTLYDQSSATPNAPIWFETQTVDVYRGRFTVLLGLCDQNPAASACPDGDPDAASIEDVIRNADDLQLGVELFPDLTSIALQNRKRFLPVPYAVWTRAAADLEVAHDLAVRHNAAVTNDTSIGHDLAVTRNASVGGTLTVGGVLTASGLTVNGPLRAGGGGDLSCPNNSRTTYGICWWMIGGYSRTYRQAASACVAEGGRLCSISEMSGLHASGLENCQYGWVADRVNTTTAYAGYPMQNYANGCGGPGLIMDQRAMTDLLAANCCK